ncbi:uncharacterized protein LOC126716158 [Quercus robur]|uniref:uncharacterized protein LOC126716158 n=1 Tax=Quercus robur TaxID=38942 RepID=UPI0021625930|nr:uncharacterized protein LOC126716158 [Quercus robur]
MAEKTKKPPSVEVLELLAARLSALTNLLQSKKKVSALTFHKLKFFLSLPCAAASPSTHSLPLLQSIVTGLTVTAARYQSTQGQASLFSITVEPPLLREPSRVTILPKLRRLFKLVRFRRRRRRPISLFNKKTSSLFLVCEAVPSPNSHGVKVSLKQRSHWSDRWFRRYLAIVSSENPQNPLCPPLSGMEDVLASYVFGKKKTTEVAHLEDHEDLSVKVKSRLKVSL